MKLASAATLVGLYRGLGLLGRAGTVLVLSKVLGPDVFGQYNVLIVAATLVAGFGMFGTQHAHSYLLNTGKITDAEALGNALVSSVAVVAVVWSVLVAFEGIPLMRDLAAPAWVLAILVAAMLLQGHLGAHLLARNAVHPFAVITQGFNLVVFASVGVMALAGALTARSAWAAYAIVVTLASLYGLVKVVRLTGQGPRFAPAALPAALRFGASVVVGNLLLTLMYRLDYLLLGSLASYGEVGRYAVATTAAEVFLLLPQALGTVVFPKVSASTAQVGAETAAKSVGVSMVLSLGSVAVGILPAVLLLGPVFGPEYAMAWLPMVLLMPGVVGMSIAYVLFQYYSGIGQPNVPAMLLGVAVVINIAFNFLLIPRFGASGAAVASSIAYLIAGLGGAIVFRRGADTSRYPIWKLPISGVIRGIRSLRTNRAGV